jgi:hypothetical protein
MREYQGRAFDPDLAKEPDPPGFSVLSDLGVVDVSDQVGVAETDVDGRAHALHSSLPRFEQDSTRAPRSENPARAQHRIAGTIPKQQLVRDVLITGAKRIDAL